MKKIKALFYNGNTGLYIKPIFYRNGKIVSMGYRLYQGALFFGILFYYRIATCSDITDANRIASIFGLENKDLKFV